MSYDQIAWGGSMLFQLYLLYYLFHAGCEINHEILPFLFVEPGEKSYFGNFT